MGTTIRFKFELKGDFDPKTVTTRAGLEPTSFHRKGDQSKYGKNKLDFDYWCLDTGYINSLDLEEISSTIYQQLKTKEDQFSAIIKEFNLLAVFSVVAKIENQNAPSVHFSKELVGLANILHASFDVDLYVADSE
jgi:hypothetical protein